ncbi:alpha/beta hydrolase [Microbacterium sp. X-17]|uniref:alpha/beta fold hydrolase n=1 Tax=Microbacterium sp. X-17 TaxID=3144404 RepID=UPI0031F4AEF6
MRLELSDGTTIAYDDSGTGDRAVLLAHGLGCDRSTMAAQVAALEPDFRVINVDLRGHGESDKPVQGYHPDVFAHDLAEVSRLLDLDKPVLVGHSLGGVSGLRLTHLYPGLLSGLVAMDSAWAVSDAVAEFARPMLAGYEAMPEDEYLDELRVFLRSAFFLPSDEGGTREKIVASMSSAPRYMFLSCWYETVVNTDTVGPLRELDIPTLFIAAQTPNADLDVVRRESSVVIAQTVGSGHFIQHYCADQTTPMVKRFLQLNGLA